MPAAAKLNVTVVDDQLTIRALVRTSLQLIGITQVKEYPGAAEALAAVVLTPPHVIISDFNMPEMDGLEFLRALRANPAMANTAFILLTGRADKDLVARAMQFGANNYLVKPFTAANLKEKIEQIFGALT